MRQVVLFDFGGVVIRSPFELAAGLERRHGLTPGSVLMRGPFDPDVDCEWQRFMQGEISERDYWQHQADDLSAFLGDGDDSLRAMMDELFDLAESDIVRPETELLVEDLVAAGHAVAALTNDMSRFHSEEWLERMTIIKRFDPLIDLSYTGVLKPSPDAYAHALAELGCGADQVLFIDDQAVNVAGAEAAGIRSIWFDVTRPAVSVAFVRGALATA